ncbi:conserved protein, unknown function [Plasmodium vivax]|uniref:Uncharacterized protein n=6 Tax=Plasmodium vivax TaxID=5855 RepID=A5K9W6_PLAVS|nr:hypothetical protein, conserved [Plasmodium vivax]KMZ82756.1 hypothetical protein PVIIG_03571 [Plasmodium vivax India VII]KMZ89253.1 hypothetical protein PVBG_03603 [Plasmodium vivax Brazil I]KMZ95575.1 hypothetical protein PVMG_04368 [Plasmodium vivax Mauritania I]KNA02039.1 hypothetical protein PVNG_04153 [Plasmodium vivax North Korean]EDL43854.1 hypothetical protein, conserved [Plasmodium vivax]|eukprot:XP_001613581.1 hypothetical protein [Plasmodium vivax Sal-1]
MRLLSAAAQGLLLGRPSAQPLLRVPRAVHPHVERPLLGYLPPPVSHFSTKRNNCTGYDHPRGAPPQLNKTYHSQANFRDTKMEFCQVDLDEFCYKQFDSTKKSCSFIPYDKNEFLDKVNELIRQKKIKVVPGYAGFCKHIFVENFTEATVETIEINNKNRDLIKTDYISRRDNELPVLIRWISKKDVKDIIKAKYLDLILYSREQIEKENKETKTVPNRKSNCLYSIICIKPQNVDYELPMTPITMLRNTLISEGGSGINLNRDKYLESVKYWRHHVSIIDN